MTMRAPIHDLHRTNLVTYLSLVSGMGAIAMARSDGVPLAGVALAISAIADTFDGRFARRFSRTARQARIGHELDSLVDAVVFGAAPAVVVASQLSASGGELFFAWAAASVYLVAVVTRLAYYNVQKDDGGFVGVPAPAAALVC